MILVPKPVPFGLFQADGGSSYLRRPRRRETQYDVGVLDVPDGVLTADSVAHAPAGGVEPFADGADDDGVPRECRVQCGDLGQFERVVKVLVDFI